MDYPQLTDEIAKATPPVAVTGTITALANDLDPWLKILGFVFIVLQILFLCYRAWRLRKQDKKDDE